MAIPMKPGELDELEVIAALNGLRTALLLAHVSGQSAAYNDAMGIVAKPPSLISGLTQTVAGAEKRAGLDMVPDPDYTIEDKVWDEAVND